MNTTFDLDFFAYLKSVLMQEICKLENKPTSPVIEVCIEGNRTQWFGLDDWGIYPKLLWNHRQTPDVWMFGLGLLWSNQSENLTEALNCVDQHRQSLSTRVSSELLYYWQILGFEKQSIYPQHLSLLPRLLLKQASDAIWVRLYTFDMTEMDQVKKLIETLFSQTLEKVQPSLVSKTILTHKPNRHDFQLQIDSLIARLKSDEKIVLSRLSQINLEAPIGAFRLLYEWKRQVGDSFTFCAQMNEHSAWLSCSPESLLEVQGLEITTESIAGTVVVNSDPVLDKANQNQLLTDQKIKQEQAIVTQFIMDILKEQETNPILSSRECLSLTYVHHLRNTIKAHLKTTSQWKTILRLLFPTPAVSGYPKEWAMAEIKALEKHSRGWYSGALGVWEGDGRRSFCVSIRSAWLEDNRIDAYAGGGILNSSEAALEWEELNNKIKPLLRTLDLLGYPIDTIE